MSGRFINGLYHVDGLGTMTTLPAPVDPIGTGTSKDWQIYGWPSKTAYRQAGQPQMQYSEWRAAHPETGGATTGGSSSNGGRVVGPPIARSPEDTPDANGDTSGGSLASFFSGIPTSYLLIGGAIVAVMLLKKR